MTVPRRLLLTGLGAAAIGAASTATSAPASALPRAFGVGESASHPGTVPFGAGEVSPVEHFRLMQKALMDSDNLFGPQRVIPAVAEQIQLMQQLRTRVRGRERQDLLQLQTQYADLCGWLYQDIGDHHAAQYWSARGLEWSHLAENRESVAFILARRSQLAGDMHDPADAVQAGQAAERFAPDTSRVKAVAATYTAHGHALDGDTAACQRAYDRAHELFAQVDDDPDCPWALFFDDAYIQVQRARSLTVLGDYRTAIDEYAAAITRLPDAYRRDQGVYLAREAHAYSGSGEPEQAADTGLQALAIATDTGSGRILGELAQLDQQLARWSGLPAVTRLHDAVHDLTQHET